MFDSGDVRMKGENSALTKSLKILKEQKLVDHRRNNLIAVGTKAVGGMGLNAKMYKQKRLKVTQKVQEAVRRYLGVSNVPVVFVENKPEDYNLEPLPGAEFIKLPDGEMSHGSLIREMQKLFMHSRDKLGLLLTSWYFRKNCSEKYETADKEVIFEDFETGVEAIDASSRELCKALFGRLGYNTTFQVKHRS